MAAMKKLPLLLLIYHNPRKYSNLEFYCSTVATDGSLSPFFTMAASSLPLNFTSLLPLIYHGSTMVLPWHKGNLKYGLLATNSKKINTSQILV